MARANTCLECTSDLLQGRFNYSPTHFQCLLFVC